MTRTDSEALYLNQTLPEFLRKINIKNSKTSSRSVELWYDLVSIQVDRQYGHKELNYHLIKVH